MQSRIPCTLEFQQIPPDGLPWIVYSRAKKKDADLVSARTTPDGKRNQPWLLCPTTDTASTWYVSEHSTLFRNG